MELERHEIHRRLRERDFCIEEKELVNMITDAFRITRRLTNNDDFFSYIPDNANHNMNPMLWEYGHFLGFWENLIIKNLNGDLDILNDYTFIFNPISRFFQIIQVKPIQMASKLLNLEAASMSKIEERCFLLLKVIIVRRISCLWWRISMHNESFIFSLNQQGTTRLILATITNLKKQRLEDIPLALSSRRAVVVRLFFFDNESYRFETHIDDFTVAKI